MLWKKYCGVLQRSFWSFEKENEEGVVLDFGGFWDLLRLLMTQEWLNGKFHDKLIKSKLYAFWFLIHWFWFHFWIKTWFLQICFQFFDSVPGLGFDSGICIQFLDFDSSSGLKMGFLDLLSICWFNSWIWIQLLD